ncbi:MAG TPA: F0F1 ATP synthase subunit B' [Stellaceae bacterium]|nr:F0F1 ATP synthase subunit B' [Stellaceae bacterium]
MPQLDIGSFAPQLVWLAISFVVLYLLMAKLGLPRVGAAIEARRHRLDQDLTRAQALRDQAAAALAAYEAAQSQARATAQATIREAAGRLAAAAAERQRELAVALSQQVGTAEREIAAASERALAEIRGVAVEVTASIAAKLTGTPVDEREVAAAVDGVIAERAS